MPLISTLRLRVLNGRKVTKIKVAALGRIWVHEGGPPFAGPGGTPVASK